jgi:hypothetical protein
LCGSDEKPISQRQCVTCAASATAAEQVSHLSGGLPLPEALRSELEQHFETDLAGVRVHTDAASSRAAASLRASAFTHGSDIAFAAEKYDPISRDGVKLIVHETAHVVQQRSAPANALSGLDAGPSDPFEQAAAREADRFGTRGPRSPAPRVPSGSVPRVARQPDDPSQATAIGRVVEMFGSFFSSPEADPLFERRAELDWEIFGTVTDIADQINAPSGGDLATIVALKLQLAALNREHYLTEVALANPTLWRQPGEKPEAFVQRLTDAAASEEKTIELSEQIVPEPGHLSEVSRDLVLKNPEWFPKYQIRLYAEVVEMLGRTANDYWDQYQARVAPIVGRPPKELIPDFLVMMQNHEELRKQARRMGGMTFFLLDPEAPVTLDLKAGSPTAGIGNISARVNDLTFERRLPDLESNLGMFYRPLVSYYYSVFYADAAKQMSLFSLALDQTLERLNQGPFSTPDVIADLGRAYASSSPQVGWDTMEAQFERIYREIETKLDTWVAKLPWQERIREGFGLYDLPAEIVEQIKDLVSWKSLAILAGFVALIIGLQFVPFGNLVIDAMLLGAGLLLGIDVLKTIVVFGLYFDEATDATTFRTLFNAAQGLRGIGGSIVNILIELLTLAGGGAWAKFRTMRRIKSIDELAGEEAIVRGRPAIRRAFEEARGLSRRATKWEAELNPETMRLLEQDETLARRFAEMDPEVRELLTLCESVCIPPDVTVAQESRIKALLNKLNMRGSDRRLKEFFHSNWKRLDEAIDALSKAKDKSGFTEVFEQSIQERAAVKHGTARFRKDGLVEFVRKDGEVILENELGSHSTLTAEDVRTESFFQSHHGIQDAWAEERIPSGLYSRGEGQAILLRDSRLGTPHQIVNSRQAARGGTIAERTYAEERQLLLEDMDEARVSKTTAQRLLSNSDAYFAKIYRTLATRRDAAALKSIFGRWKP